MEEKYRSRKFIVTVGCVLIATIMAALGKLTGELTTVLTIAIGGYNLANAWAGK